MTEFEKEKASNLFDDYESTYLQFTISYILTIYQDCR